MTHTENLTVEQHQMLVNVVEAGGHLSIRGLSDAEMAHATFVTLALHHLGLLAEPLIHKSRRKGADIIDEIAIDLTDKGRQCMVGS